MLKDTGIFKELIVETVKLGGSLVFLTSSKKHGDFSKIVSPLMASTGAFLPSTTKTFEELEAGVASTCLEDLVIFSLEDFELLKKVSHLLQGQRLAIAHATHVATDFDAYYVDYIFESLSLPSWKSLFSACVDALKASGPIVHYDRSEESPCLFLDRDDVIVNNVPYNKDPEQVTLREGIVDLIRKAHDKNYWVAMVTNQSGLGRGKFDWEEYRGVHQKMMELLAQESCWIDESEWAGFVKTSDSVPGRRFASLRKPRNGMFLAVKDKLKPQMSQSLMVGDSATDLIAAYLSGVGKLVLVGSDKHAVEIETLEKFKEFEPAFSYQFCDHLNSVKELL